MECVVINRDIASVRKHGNVMGCEVCSFQSVTTFLEPVHRKEPRFNALH
jgi:hypothetical protein